MLKKAQRQSNKSAALGFSGICISLIIGLTSLTACSSLDMGQAESETPYEAPMEEQTPAVEEESPLDLSSDQQACLALKTAFEDLFAMSEAGYSQDDLNQQRILGYEVALEIVEDEYLRSLFQYLRDWNLNPVGLSVNEYREMQSICGELGIDI